MMNESMLNEYARLIVRVGVNLQKGQPAVINAPIECADFARRIAREGCSDTVGGREVRAASFYEGSL